MALREERWRAIKTGNNSAMWHGLIYRVDCRVIITSIMFLLLMAVSYFMSPGSYRAIPSTDMIEPRASIVASVTFACFGTFVYMCIADRLI